MSKKIEWDNRKWLIDYATFTIIEEPKDNKDISISKRQFFKFREINNIIYFRNAYNIYKIENGNVNQITEQEYNDSDKYIILLKNNSQTTRLIANNIVSVLLEETFKKKYNIELLITCNNEMFIESFVKKFPPVLTNKIRILSRKLLYELPRRINSKELKEEIRKLIIGDFLSEEELKKYIELIYLSDDKRFDLIATQKEKDEFVRSDDKKIIKKINN